MDPESQEAPEPQDQPAPETPAPELSDQADKPDIFSEKFDPASLPDELLPRYRQMTADYTQKTQSLAEQRKEIEQEQQLLQALRSNDPDLQAQALELLGLEFAQQEQEQQEEFEDPYESRLAALEQALQSQAQQQQEEQFQAQMTDYLEQQLSSLEQSTGRQFDDEEVSAILAQAYVQPNQDGLPGVQQAFDHLYTKVLAKERQRWVQSKQSGQPGQGESGSPTVDLKNDQSRRAELARVIQAGMDVS